MTAARAWLHEHTCLDAPTDLEAVGAVAEGSAAVAPPATASRTRHGRRGAQSTPQRRPAPDPSVGDGAADADADADPESVARTVVLRKLAARARTRQELVKALAAKAVPEEVATEVLDRMESVGLVDDATFARDWVESRQQRRHLSRSALRRELQVKGVTREAVEEAVAGVGGDDELEAAETLASKKLRTMQGLERDVQYRRLAGVLGRRGFGPEVTRAVLDRVLGRHGD